MLKLEKNKEQQLLSLMREGMYRDMGKTKRKIMEKEKLIFGQ